MAAVTAVGDLNLLLLKLHYIYLNDSCAQLILIFNDSSGSSLSVRYFIPSNDIIQNIYLEFYIEPPTPTTFLEF